ncbi:MAG: hypothetical protein WKF96_19470 [Solirubrobacteraceae bacterium]
MQDQDFAHAQRAASGFTRRARSLGWLVLFDTANTGRVKRIEPIATHPSPITERAVRRRAERISRRLVAAYALRHVEHAQGRRRHGATVPRAWQLWVPEETTAITSPTSPPARSAPRQRGAGRPRSAATRSSKASGDSPTDGPPHQQDAAPLRLAPPARAVLVFGARPAAVEEAPR